MIIESWIAAIIMIALALIGIVALFMSIVEGQRLEDANHQIKRLEHENGELKRYIAVQRTKNIIGVANDFNNEGKKK
jgi:signal transduction histidine kinase